MVSYRDDQEEPWKGKQLCNYRQTELSESDSLPVKWTSYIEGNLRSSPLPLLICVSIKGTGKRSPRKVCGE